MVAGVAVSLLIFAGLFKASDFFIQASVVQSSGASGVKFKDKLPAWASDSIYRLNAAGVIKGYSNGKFGPSDNLTRGQVVTMLYRTLKYKSIIQDPSSTQCPSYNDVKSTDYFYTPVCLLALNTGSTVLSNDPEIFDPNVKVTRAEAAKLIDAMLGDTFLQSLNKTRGTDVVFQDVPEDNPYFDDIALVYMTGLMTGKQDGSFDPNGLLTRAEMAVVMDRTLNLLESLKIKELAEKIDKEAYMAECADLIDEQTTACSGYENWDLDIQIVKQNTKTHKSTVEVNEIILGPGNECDSSKAGEKFPAEFKSAFLDKQESGNGEEIQVLCKVSCVGWNDCPSDEKLTNTCTGGAMKTSDCLQSCDGTCEASQDQVNCSVCVPCDDGGEDGGTITPPVSDCGERPFYDCSQCNGLPSYPTFAYENCLTSCENAYQNASIEYNRCLEQN